jgi:Holliday junction DNA helicase RuvA
MVIDVGGVGYEVEAPLSVFYDLPETGQAVVILTHLSIKDDSHTLYGFSSEAQRTVFRQLLKISGIGAKLALTILSGASSEELARYVAEEDSAALTRLPGIGKKTAERIIIELRDKLDVIPLASASGPGSRPAAPASAVSEAITALNALGYKPQESSSMVRAVAEPDMSVEEIIRLALKSMVKTR